MKAGRKSLANTKGFTGVGLEAVKQFALMGDVGGPAYGIVHCLDGLLSKHGDFSVDTAPKILHGWVRQIQAIDLAAVADSELKAAVQKWLKERAGTDFHAYHALLRILMLIVAPLAEARRRKDGAFVRSLARLIEESHPAPGAEYDETSTQTPIHRGLYAAALGVERALHEGRMPRLNDIRRALKDAGLTADNLSSAKRYAKVLRDAGIQFDQRPGRRTNKQGD